MFETLQYIIIATGGVAFVCFVFFLSFYWRNEKRESVRLKQTRTDIADMTILFQTMRDIIKQQKELARDFNHKLDTKMSMVKQVLAQGIDRNKELYEKQQALTQQLEESQQQLQSLQRQIIHLREVGEVAPRPVREPVPETRVQPPQPVQTAPPPRPVAPPRPTPPVEFVRPEPGHLPAAFADWADFDLEPEALAPILEEEAVHAPEAPGDAQAARNAFRALLDLDPHPAYRPLDASAEKPLPSAAGGNGGAAQKLTPLQRRVLEYHEAGMGVTEIAQELGVGKGEVRLMLNLIRQKP